MLNIDQDRFELGARKTAKGEYFPLCFDRKTRTNVPWNLPQRTKRGALELAAALASQVLRNEARQ